MQWPKCLISDYDALTWGDYIGQATRKHTSIKFAFNIIFLHILWIGIMPYGNTNYKKYLDCGLTFGTSQSSNILVATIHIFCLVWEIAICNCVQLIIQEPVRYLPYGTMPCIAGYTSMAYDTWNMVCNNDDISWTFMTHSPRTSIFIKLNVNHMVR